MSYVGAPSRAVYKTKKPYTRVFCFAAGFRNSHIRHVRGAPKMAGSLFICRSGRAFGVLTGLR